MGDLRGYCYAWRILPCIQCGCNIYLFICQYMLLHQLIYIVCPSICPSICLSVYLFICLSIHLFVYLSILIHLLIYLSSFDIFTYPFVYLGLSLERKVSLSSKTLDKSLQSSLFHCHQISGLCKQKPIVISKLIMDQFGKTTLGSPHSRRNTSTKRTIHIFE